MLATHEAPLLTVVCTVYQAASRITPLLSNLSDLLTTHPCIEVIVVDDASPDGSLQRLEAFQASQSFGHRLQVLGKASNRGVSDSRNIGIHMASGRYICFLDDDDRYDVEAMSKLLAVLSGCADDLIAINAWEHNGTERKKLRHPTIRAQTGSQYFASSLRNTGGLMVHVCLYAYRRAFILQHQWEFKVGIIHEDCLSTVQAMIAAQRVSQFAEPVYHYIRRPNSITTETNSAHMQRRIDGILTVVESLFDEYGGGERFTQTYLALRQCQLLRYALRIAAPLIAGETRTRYLTIVQQISARNPYIKPLRYVPPGLLRNKAMRTFRSLFKDMKRLA
ncbi:MAG: glycosyltransferase family 2 protein [Aquabacterium sp.]|uniref:glycosyltransferase family 2 protein n=1 Tax=Aquabacterium sp. TaxID=1872578 RepID=UPI003BE778A8